MHRRLSKVQDVSIWNRLLDTEEVSQFSTLGIDGNENDQSLVGNWIFNTVEGQILIDYSGNQNHGTIYGATWVENDEENLNVEVIIPNGGEVWQMGETYDLSWDANLSNTGIFLHKNEEMVLVIHGDVYTDTSFLWTVPTDLEPGDDYKIRIKNAAGPEFDFSDNNFSIIPPYILGCTDELACNYNEEATGNDGSCEYPEEFYNCDGGCINDSDSDLICDENDSCPLDPENDIDEDGLCCSDSSYLFFDSNDNVSLTAFDLTNSSVTFSFDVILEGDSHIFGQHNDGHLKIGYYSFPAFTGTQVPDNTNYIALSTWQGGPWDQLVIYEEL